MLCFHSLPNGSVLSLEDHNGLLDHTSFFLLSPFSPAQRKVPPSCLSKSALQLYMYIDHRLKIFKHREHKNKVLKNMCVIFVHKCVLYENNVFHLRTVKLQNEYFGIRAIYLPSSPLFHSYHAWRKSFPCIQIGTCLDRAEWVNSNLVDCFLLALHKAPRSINITRQTPVKGPIKIFPGIIADGHHYSTLVNHQHVLPNLRFLGLMFYDYLPLPSPVDFDSISTFTHQCP